MPLKRSLRSQLIFNRPSAWLIDLKPCLKITGKQNPLFASLQYMKTKRLSDYIYSITTL